MEFDHHSLIQLLGCIDLTSLGESDTPDSVEARCVLAASAPAPPAALCIYPEYVWLARQRLDQVGLRQVAIASVANFPDGGTDPQRVTRECRRLRAAGTQEVDVVLPYRALRAGDTQTFAAVARAAREAVGDGVMKCILETGELSHPELIQRASEIALAAGADFLKTSTGKVAINATLSAAEVMLGVIARSSRPCGFKAAGGIRTVDEAASYVALSCRILGESAFTPSRFRIGASALFDQALAALHPNASSANGGHDGRY